MEQKGHALSRHGARLGFSLPVSRANEKPGRVGITLGLAGGTDSNRSAGRLGWAVGVRARAGLAAQGECAGSVEGG